MLGEQAMFLDFVKQIACARNLQSYQKSVENLRKSKLYTDNSKVEEYRKHRRISRTFLP